MWNDNGAFGGDGGFDNTNMFTTPSQDEGKTSGKAKSRCIAPVTVNMVLSCSDDGLNVGDNNIQIVKLCGIVRNIDVSSIKIAYKLDDGTGVITGASYIEAADTEQTVPVMENTYCIMVGSIRSQGEEKHIMIFNIYPITNFNEIIEHALSVVHMGLKAEQMSKDMETKHEIMKQEVLSAGGFNQQSVAFNMEPHVRKVFDIITRCMKESGISRTEVMSAAAGMPPKQITAGIDYLIQEGHIFTTIDDDHFKSTAAA